jgi:hypothetical protein
MNGLPDLAFLSETDLHSRTEKELAARLKRVWDVIHKHCDPVGRYVRGEPAHPLMVDLEKARATF